MNNEQITKHYVFVMQSVCFLGGVVYVNDTKTYCEVYFCVHSVLKFEIHAVICELQALSVLSPVKELPECLECESG